MIHNTDTLNKPGERQYGNSIEAGIAALQKNRTFALERQKKGFDVTALLAYYDEQIARLKNL
jgi:hypothetical protein